MTPDLIKDPSGKNYTIATGRFVAIVMLILFWVNSTYAFVLQFAFDYATFLRLFGNKVTLLSELTVIAFGTILIRKKSDIALLVSFVIVTFYVVIFIYAGTFSQWFHGIRFYSGFLFMIPILRFLTDTEARRTYFMHLFDKSIYIFLWLQGPAMIWQLIYYGGWDYGGGTYGVMYSGQISSIIFVMSFYLMLKKWNFSLNYYKNIKKNWILCFLLYPCFLNETKISFIFLVLYFLMLIPIDKKYIKNMLIMVPCIILFTGVTVWLYNSLYGEDEAGQEVLSLDYLEYYMFGDDVMLDVIEMAFENSNEFEFDMQRGIKYAALPMVMDREPGSWIYGYGIGQIKGSSIENPTPFYREYTWLVDGTFMSIALLLIEMGILGIIWLIFYIFNLFRFYQKPISRQKQLSVFMVIMIILMLTYNTSLSMIQFYIPFFYVAFFSSRWNMVKQLNEKEIQFARSLKNKKTQDTL